MAIFSSLRPRIGGGTISACVTCPSQFVSFNLAPASSNSRIRSSSGLFSPACSCLLSNIWTNSTASKRDAATPWRVGLNMTWTFLACGSSSSSALRVPGRWRSARIPCQCGTAPFSIVLIFETRSASCGTPSKTAQTTMILLRSVLENSDSMDATMSSFSSPTMTTAKRG